MNKPDLAKECYLAVIDNFPKEFEFYDRILTITPDDKTIWIRKGEVLDVEERYEESLNCYDKATEIDFEDKEVWSSRDGSLASSKGTARLLTASKKQ